jgi:16S rRNA U516 pseudouridylate synthase RsuA-like enzyme
VVRLKRVRFGPLALGRLRPGASRPLTDAEVMRLKRLHAGNRPPIMRQLPIR